MQKTADNKRKNAAAAAADDGDFILTKPWAIIIVQCLPLTAEAKQCQQSVEVDKWIIWMVRSVLHESTAPTLVTTSTSLVLIWLFLSV